MKALTPNISRYKACHGASLIVQLVKNLPAYAGDLGSIPGLGRSPGEGNGNSLQYSCLENPMGRGTWQATVHRITRVGHDLVTKPSPPLLYMHAEQLQSCPTLGSSGPRDRTHISMSPALAGRFFTTSTNWEARHYAVIKNLFVFSGW